MSPVRGVMMLLLSLVVALGHPIQGNPHLAKGQVRSGAAAVDRHGDPLPALARARLGTLRFRHGAPVTQLQFARDGQTLFSVDDHGIARLWETATGKERYHFSPMGQGRSEWLLTPNNRILVTVGDDSSIELRELANNKLLHRLTSLNGSLSGPQLTPDGKTLLAVALTKASGKAVIRLWDLASGKHLRDIMPAPPRKGQKLFVPAGLHFVAGGKVLASFGRQGEKGSLRLWNFASGQEMPMLTKFPRSTEEFALASDCKVAVTFIPEKEKKGRLSLVEVATGKEIHQLRKSQLAPLSQIVRFSPDSRTLAVWDLEKLWLWDVASGKQLPAPRPAEGTSIGTVVFAPDSRTFALATGDASLSLYETATSKQLHELRGYSASRTAARADIDFEGNVVFSADGKRVAASGAGNSVRLWNTANGKEIRPVSDGHEGEVRALAVSPDGKRIASAATDGTVRVWEMADGREVRRWVMPFERESPSTGPSCVAFSPDGKSIAAGSGSGLVYLWDVVTGEARLRLRVHHKEDDEERGGVTSLAFTADGRQLIAGSEKQVFWWDAGSGKLRQVFLAPEPRGPNVPASAQMVAISPDGRVLAAGGRGPNQLRLWEVATGQVRKVLPGSGPPFFDLHGRLFDGSGYPFVTFAPDGKTLAWNQPFGIQLWDLAQGKELRLFGGQSSEITSLACSPRHGFLAASSGDGTVRFWDLATGTILGEIKAPRGGFQSLAFSPDGKTLLTGGSDTTILLWDVARVMRSWRSPPRNLATEEMKVLWERLASPKGKLACEAMDCLQEMPRQAVKLLDERLKPVAPVNARRVAGLLADLDNKRFKVRKRATEELAKLADRAEPFLRKRLDEQPPLEVGLRLKGLLEKLDGLAVSAEQVRLQRAMEVLEHIGTAEARAVLRKLAGGAAARLTQDARASLERLARLPGRAP